MMKSRLYRIAAIILLVGLTGSVLIYLSAEKREDNILVTEFENSKKYRHDLEQTGGKAIVVASEFMKWFESLFEGENLAFTLAGLSIFLSAVVFIVAKTSPSDPEGDGSKNGADPGGRRS
jgi:hypothetical protein